LSGRAKKRKQAAAAKMPAGQAAVELFYWYNFIGKYFAIIPKRLSFVINFDSFCIQFCAMVFPRACSKTTR
jgi:hypothetical protein